MRAVVNQTRKQVRRLGDATGIHLLRGIAHRALAHLTTGACVLTFTALSSCGGGTTGTSSSDSLRFSGFAQDADGTRAARLSMSVVSTATNENLVDSGTNDSGDFSMELPANEEAFVVDVEGVGSTQIARQQLGVGAMASKLAVTSAGALVAEDVFEVQPLATVLCASLTVNGSTIVVSGDVGEAPCKAAFGVASQSVPLTSFRGDLIGSCAGSIETISSAGASAQGVITLDLNDAFARGCSNIKVSITSPRAPGLKSEFPVL